ncbi:hypothetical protein OsJ_28731 [Oryza sativa Japonica Group]|uniref:Uncharacterized protein n=1 Tax=Oryza sativa subsp. japonica TaxID=39947 RepID=B9G2N3_ORYSJ|nr:hypothetical protein OsJ_28731 [Oryza sativa Japonica Group]
MTFDTHVVVAATIARETLDNEVDNDHGHSCNVNGFPRKPDSNKGLPSEEEDDDEGKGDNRSDRIAALVPNHALGLLLDDDHDRPLLHHDPRHLVCMVLHYVLHYISYPECQTEKTNDGLDDYDDVEHMLLILSNAYPIEVGEAPKVLTAASLQYFLVQVMNELGYKFTLPDPYLDRQLQAPLHTSIFVRSNTNS